MKRLIYRLSSLGDVILSQAALNLPSAAETHWVVASEYAGLLRGNPKIQNVIEFDRKKSGFADWISLNRKLAEVEFDEVVDLHATLRTRIARCVFWWSCFLTGRSFPRWRRVSKSRLRRLGYVIFKNLWPRKFLPKSLRSEFILKTATLPSVAVELKLDRTLNGSSVQNLLHLVSGSQPIVAPVGRSVRVGVMPGSAWEGKRWGAEFFTDLLKTLQKSRPTWVPVIFGATEEASVRTVCEILERESIAFECATGKMPYPELAREIASLDFMIANDTGLAHLAEGLGKPVIVLYGPTTPEFGFGPGLKKSVALGAELWCRPCGKDGSMCFRMGRDRFACMQKLQPDVVAKAALELGDSLEHAGKGVGT